MLAASQSTETIQKLVDIYARAVNEVEQLQRDLDAASNPLALQAGMDKLPSELMGKVFEHVSSGDGKEALNLSRVNHHWRSISTTTPLIWNILLVNWKTKLPWIDLIISRSGKYLIMDISLSSVTSGKDPKHYRTLCSKLSLHTYCWRQFTGFQYPHWKMARGGQHINAPNITAFGITGTLTDCKLDLTKFPRLSRLNLTRSVTFDDVQERCGTLFDTVRDLKCTPESSLEYVSLFSKLEVLTLWDSAPSHLTTPLILPTVKEIHSLDGCLGTFLTNVTAPNLKLVTMDVSPGSNGTYRARIPILKFQRLEHIIFRLEPAGYIEWGEETIDGMKQVRLLGILGGKRIDTTLTTLLERRVISDLRGLDLGNCLGLTPKTLETIAASHLVDTELTTRIIYDTGLSNELLSKYQTSAVHISPLSLSSSNIPLFAGEPCGQPVKARIYLVPFSVPGAQSEHRDLRRSNTLMIVWIGSFST